MNTTKRVAAVAVVALFSFGLMAVPGHSAAQAAIDCTKNPKVLGSYKVVDTVLVRKTPTSDTAIGQINKGSKATVVYGHYTPDGDFCAAGTSGKKRTGCDGKKSTHYTVVRLQGVVGYAHFSCIKFS
ncbi:hypothetical protein GCM10022247_18880 [Allokutzneria multivorans]|uniref:SH3 domain-containing protein n=1 Tax=Allokutzneria multivorans TaxID=1142134 RepID=A0ABP7RKL4_9PSEU